MQGNETVGAWGDALDMATVSSSCRRLLCAGREHGRRAVAGQHS